MSLWIAVELFDSYMLQLFFFFFEISEVSAAHIGAEQQKQLMRR